MTRNDLIDRINYCRRELEALQAVNTGCRGCDFYQAEQCKKHGPIPDDFLDQGCDEWDWDDIPFSKVAA